ncbi:integrase catalytic domain-containing protein [Trichonephila clavipes]|nr:integrase catalytic domain-containing protein [Trichonephila clavipes]
MWTYVNSSSNPADCASRGMMPRSLVHHKLWWHGPEWLRQRYWIPNGRSFIRQVLNNCLLCKRLKKQACQQLMGELPVERITPSRPFSKVGLDYAGPLITKPNVPKFKTKLKSYICVFVCISTKAVHLGAVSDFSSAAFLAALKRFVARRGLPSDVYSDNGKKFQRCC